MLGLGLEPSGLGPTGLGLGLSGLDYITANISCLSVCLSVCEDLERALKEAENCHLKLIATDGVFSMDGNVAPLKYVIVNPH